MPSAPALHKSFRSMDHVVHPFGLITVSALAQKNLAALARIDQTVESASGSQWASPLRP